MTASEHEKEIRVE